MSELTVDDFKTEEGKNLYKTKNYDGILRFTDQNNFSKILDLINKECTEEELFLFFNETLVCYIWDDLIKYAIDKSYTKILQFFTTQYKSDIVYYTCRFTDDVDLYKKFNINDTDELISNACQSLLYENKPSHITEYILSIYEHCESVQISLNFCDDLDLMDKNLVFELIMYIVNNFNLSMGNIGFMPSIDCLHEENYVEILETLWIKETNDYIYKFANYVTDICSLPNVKYLTEKYLSDTEIILEILPRISKFDIFLYMVDIVGQDKLEPDMFINYSFDYDVMKWLIDNGFNVRPNIDYCHANRWILIITDAITKCDYSYVKSCTEKIIYKMYNEVNIRLFKDLIMELSINIFDLDILFEYVMIREIKELMDIFDGCVITNVDDVKHDLKLLDMTETLAHIDKINIS